MDYVTLIEKECGHYGLVKNRIPGEKINCSQCNILKGPQQALVAIAKKKIMPHDNVPKLNFEEMEKWLKKNLDEIKCQQSFYK